MIESTIRIPVPDEEAYVLGNSLVHVADVQEPFVPFFVNGVHALYSVFEGDAAEVRRVVTSREELSDRYRRGGEINDLDNVGRGLVWIASDRHALPDDISRHGQVSIMFANDVSIQITGTRLSVGRVDEPVYPTTGQILEVTRGFTVEPEEPATPDAKFDAHVRGASSYAVLHRINGSEMVPIPEVPAVGQGLDNVLYRTAELLDRASGLDT